MPNSNPKNEGPPQISRREALGATLIAAATLELGGLGAIAAETASTPGALPMDPDPAAYLKGPGGKLEYFPDYAGVGSNYRGDKVKPWELSAELLHLPAALTGAASDPSRLTYDPAVRAGRDAPKSQVRQDIGGAERKDDSR